MALTWRKPLPIFGEIDRSNPITKRLVFSWKPQYRTARRPYNLVNGDAGALVNSPTEVNRLWGSGIDFGSDAKYAWFGKNYLSAFSHISFEIIYIRDGSGQFGYGAPFKHTAYPDVDNHWFEMYNDGGGWGMGFNFQYTDRQRIFSMSYPTNGVVHHTILTYDHTNYNNVPLVWHDGDPISLIDRYNNGGTFLSSPPDGIYISGNTWDGVIFLVNYWSRMLTLKEVQERFRDPSGIFKQSKLFIGKPPAAPASNIRRYSFPLLGMG